MFGSSNQNQESRVSIKEVFVCFLILIGVASSFAQEQNSKVVVIDGVFDEWTEAHIVARDPDRDHSGDFDVTFLSAMNRKSVLYLHFDIGKQVNLQNGPEDGSPSFGMRIKLMGDKVNSGVGPWGSAFLDIDFRKRQISIDTGRERIAKSWADFGFECLPTYASEKYEMKIDLGNYANAEVVHNGKRYVNSKLVQFTGSDSFDDFVPVKLNKRNLLARIADPQKYESDFDLGDSKGFRIASQNTLHSGLSDPKRQDKFKRLFAAVNADVYCFQEEWDRNKFDEGVAKAVPGGDSINTHWHSNCAIATKHELTPLELDLDRAAAALVTTDNGKSVVVISCHFKCCGYAGSQEDDLRIQQGKQLVGQIKRLKVGEFGNEAKDAPVVLIGDYNLVGSRKPLDVFNSAGLKDVLCRAVDGSAYTWRGLKPDESFWPGRLDLVIVSGGLDGKGYVMDTGRMTEEQLKAMELREDDSLASDHLMSVVEINK